MAIASAAHAEGSRVPSGERVSRHTVVAGKIARSGRSPLRSMKPYLCRRILTYASVTLAFVTTMGLAKIPAAHADADPREAEARRECLAGRYQHGIDLLAALFTETKDANYIFNQARCFQQNSRPDEAISRFREYLRKAKDLPPQESAEVQRYISECEAMKAETAAVRPAASATDETLRARLADEDALRSKRLRIAGSITAGVGVAALGFAGYMTMRTRALSKDFENARKEHPEIYPRQIYNDGQRAEVLQWVGYGVGGALVGTGAVFYFLGERRQESNRVAFVPMVTNDAAGALLTGRF